jgi:hypothetical protein
MGEGRRHLEEGRPAMKSERWWGLRPWKRHSTILMVIGFMFFLAGIQYIVTKPSKAREEALYTLTQFAPVEFWGALFAAAGLMAMISSRWPPLAETWGYMVLTGLSSGWAATYLTGVIFFHTPAANLSQVIIWGCFGFMWWAISGLPNPERTVDKDHGRR